MVDQLNKNCYTKECPVCGKLLKYKRKQALVNSIKLNRKCSSCANTGKNNPFYGKQHTESHKNYISKVLKTSISYKESRIKLSQQMKGRCISESRSNIIIISMHKSRSTSSYTRSRKKYT